MQFEKYSGRDIEKIIVPLARLRIAVFREFPYLYDGDLEYEKKYLQTYARSARSLVVLAKDADGRPIGATTCLPLADEETKLQGNFAAKNYNVAEIFYFGESIVLPECRGNGLGKIFFDYREQHAHSWGEYRYAAFCAVMRPPEHPRRPAKFKSPETLWQRMGYAKLDGVTTNFAWRDLDELSETEKPMQFWIKKL